MKTFPDDVKFRFKWRPYQARVLSELREHMDDERLHVVAAPASGKTVLGIEVARRINGPTLVLAPTLAIRDQWVQRLEELFLPPGAKTPDWVSYDLSRPSFFTVSTYQLLHSVMKKEEPEPEPEEEPESPPQERKDPATFFVEDDAVDVEDTDTDLDEDEKQERKAFDWLNQKKTNYRNAPIPDLAPMLLQIGIKTVVLDEAHHLRSSWWKSLTTLIDELGDIRLLALTATPPYDVPPAEWDRYMALCGPVDAEISVPELVRVKNLCPHQDLVAFSSPSHEEAAEITTFRREVAFLLENLPVNDSFLGFLRSHKWVQNSDAHIDQILDEPDLFTSMLVYLHHIGETIPQSALDLIADSSLEIPEFNLEWLEVLLTGIFYPRSGKRPKFKSEIEDIRNKLRSMRAIERRKVFLRNPLFIEKILKRSISKMDSIVDIANAEFSSYGDNLRMVVLSDYIRKEYLPSAKDTSPELNKMGVVPIFEALRRANFSGIKLGILTGSLIVIPSESEELFRNLAFERGISGNDMEFESVPGADTYQIVKVLSHDKHKMVRVVTEFFSTGGINILVGTKSLLGEGWDAPSINSLVISSVVGSFMLSNQMRGRAIRIQPENPNKTANIWHLVCIEPDSHNPGPDYRTMVRRFRAFVGVSQHETIIENGFGRLNTGEPPFSKEEIWEVNEQIFQRSIKRSEMSVDWDTALGDEDKEVRLIEDVMFSKVQLPSSIVKTNTTASSVSWPIAILLSSLILLFSPLPLWQFFIYLNLAVESFLTLFFILLTVFCIGLCFIPLYKDEIVSHRYLWRIFRFPSFRSIAYFFRHASVKRSLKNVGNAVLQALFYSGELTTHWTEYTLQVEESEEGTVYCNIKNANRREQSIFLQALQDVLNPVEEPRYLLRLESSPIFGKKRIDYFAVPEIFGIRKENAADFQEMWKKFVFPMDLIFTRNPKGRLVLLKARIKSRSVLKGTRSKMLTRWK
ncbi:MAG: DEAD/DEAH box helicase family protein [Candidatus Thorarchaeota archaeon]|nr:DEAD/DEAH box helicase family protein [Candidatus Thorarchaeota archaeon]